MSSVELFFGVPFRSVLCCIYWEILGPFDLCGVSLRQEPHRKYSSHRLRQLIQRYRSIQVQFVVVEALRKASA